MYFWFWDELKWSYRYFALVSPALFVVCTISNIKKQHRTYRICLHDRAGLNHSKNDKQWRSFALAWQFRSAALHSRGRQVELWGLQYVFPILLDVYSNCDWSLEPLLCVLTCRGAPVCGPWRRTEAHPPWRSAPSVHQWGVLWSGHSWELHKGEKKANV